MLVGHNPLFERLPGYLLNASNLQVDFKKGAIMRIDFDHFTAKPKGVLKWYFTARLASGD